MNISDVSIAGLLSEYRFVAIAIVTPVILAGFAWTAKRPVARDGEWSVMCPSVGLYLLAVLGSLLALLGLIAAVISALAVMQTYTPLALIDLGGGGFLAFIGIYVLVTTLFIRIRFNEQGIERRLFTRSTYFPWSEVMELRRHPQMGPRVISKDGRYINISQYRIGHPDLEELLRIKGIPIAT
ncbi:MAG: hypothetical protein ACTHPD_05620 [Rhizomicrobium sp.]